MESPPPPRLRLAHLPTPLEPLDRLGGWLGMAPGALMVKRDDATGLAGGGNKPARLAATAGSVPTPEPSFWHTGGMPALFASNYAAWTRG